jgi:polyhydroxyalkanoate synthesis regulator phasin
MIESFKKTILAGLGAAVVTGDKVQERLDEFVKQGKITADRGPRDWGEDRQGGPPGI